MGSAISETELWLYFICSSAQQIEVVVQLVLLWSLCPPFLLLYPTLLPHDPNPINEFVNAELEFGQEYLKMPSHIAWIYKEEIIQTIDAP